LKDLHYHERNTPNRLGMTEIRNVEGEYRMWDDILARFPHLFIDNCCGGTMRQDLETLSRAISLWNTDATGPYIPVGNINQVSLQNQMMSANINRYIPYSICGTMGTTPYAIRSGFNAGLCYMDDIRLPQHKRDLDLINKGLRQWSLPEIDKLEDFTERKREQLKKGIAEAKRIRKYYLGNFYPHSGANLNARDWCVIQYHRPTYNDGIILAFRRHESPVNSYITNLCEIDPEADYKVIQSLTFKQSKPSIIRGVDLTNLNITIDDCPGSMLVEYSQEDPEYTSIQNEDSIESARSWEFNNWNESEGWIIPESINGGILGGAIWIMILSELDNFRPVSWKHQVWGPNLKHDLESPRGLAIPANQFNEIRIKLRNLSPETDGYIFWRSYRLQFSKCR